MRIFFSVVVFIFIAFGCCKINKDIIKDSLKFTKQAEDRFGNDYKYLFNTDSSYVLVINQKKPTAENPFPLLKFFVFDFENDAVVFEDVLPKSKVNWKNNYLIQVETIPGMVSKENSNNIVGYIYNLKLKEKIDLK